MEEIYHKAKIAFYSLFGKRTWQMLEYFDPSWTKRISEMAKYVPEGESVLDLGCGKMWLRQFHKAGNYYPVDYTDRGEGTFVCDFNKNEFPSQRADIAFVSGTLEYVIDPKWFIAKIAANCNKCVISYCTLEDYPDLKFRRKQAWVNDYSRNEIIELFSSAGFRLTAENTEIPRNRIFAFAKGSV